MSSSPNTVLSQNFLFTKMQVKHTQNAGEGGKLVGPISTAASLSNATLVVQGNYVTPITNISQLFTIKLQHTNFNNVI